MSFLPEGSTIPAKEGKYTKFSEPENKIRVLASAVTGFKLWVSGKPIRKKQRDSFTQEELLNADTNKFNGKKRAPEYFWAFPCYNYQTGKVEVAEVTQVTIMRGIEDYLKDEDYGDPKEYDLNIIRDEAGDKVEYRVKAKPPKALEKGIRDLYESTSIDLEALFEGEDPFSQATEDKNKRMYEEDIH